MTDRPTPARASRPPPSPEALARMRSAIIVVIGVPAVIAVVTTLAQAWPATLAIDALADHDDGRYGVKAAIMLTWLGLLVGVLLALVPLAIIVSLVRRARR